MRSLALAVLLVVSVVARADVLPTHDSSRNAVTIAQSLLDAVGGVGSWIKVRYVRFDMIAEKGGKKVVRSYYWDRSTSRYRVDGVDKEGVFYEAQAKRWLDGAPATLAYDSYCSPGAIGRRWGRFGCRRRARE
ncbi:MAG TPA: hypothetical protein VGL86_01845 [Polyangia bacterium]